MLQSMGLQRAGHDRVTERQRQRFCEAEILTRRGVDGEFSPQHIRGSGCSRGKPESLGLTSQMASGRGHLWGVTCAHFSPSWDDPRGLEKPDKGAHTAPPGRTVAS